MKLPECTLAMDKLLMNQILGGGLTTLEWWVNMKRNFGSISTELYSNALLKSEVKKK